MILTIFVVFLPNKNPPLADTKISRGGLMKCAILIYNLVFCVIVEFHKYSKSILRNLANICMVPYHQPGQSI